MEWIIRVFARTGYEWIAKYFFLVILSCARAFVDLYYWQTQDFCVKCVGHSKWNFVRSKSRVFSLFTESWARFVRLSLNGLWTVSAYVWLDDWTNIFPWDVFMSHTHRNRCFILSFYILDFLHGDLLSSSSDTCKFEIVTVVETGVKWCFSKDVVVKSDNKADIRIWSLIMYHFPRSVMLCCSFWGFIGSVYTKCLRKASRKVLVYDAVY